MPNSGLPFHIDISIGYPEKSIPFYAAFFESLGYRRWEIDAPAWRGPNPKRATWLTTHSDGSQFGVEVRPAREKSRDRAYDRYEPGPHHIAFHAASCEGVDKVHAAMLAVGADVLDPPTEYGGEPGYGKAYYAAFYADPDGMKVEVAYVPKANP
jgi:glyoxylase I family protein